NVATEAAPAPPRSPVYACLNQNAATLRWPHGCWWQITRLWRFRRYRAVGDRARAGRGFRGLDGEQDGARVAAPGGLGERTGRRCPGGVAAGAGGGVHPPRGSGRWRGRHLRWVIRQQPDPRDVPVRGDLDGGGELGPRRGVALQLPWAATSPGLGSP